MRLFRRAHLGESPTELEPGERVLARGRIGDGTYVVATDCALLLPDGEQRFRRLPWHTLTHATWDQDQQVLAIDEVGSDGAEQLRHRLPLEDPGFVPETVRERVMASILVSQHVRLDGRRGVRIVARQVPGEDEPVWQLVFDAGVDSDDPVLRRRAEHALEDLRRQTLG